MDSLTNHTDITVQQQVAIDLLKHNVGFLISPNIERYALSTEQIAEMKAMVEEAKASQLDPRTANGRLLQARHTIKTLTEAMKDALRNGEAEDSPYINKLVSRIGVLITQVSELEALTGQEGRQVA